MHLESASGCPVCVTWRRPPLLGAQRAKEPRSRARDASRSGECAPGRSERASERESDSSLFSQTPAAGSGQSVPPLAPSHAAAAVVPDGGGGGGFLAAAPPPHTRSRLWSFRSCAGKTSSGLFLYRGRSALPGPGAPRWPRPLICMGRRPLPAGCSGRRALSQRPPELPAGWPGAVGVCARVCIGACDLHTCDLWTAPRPHAFPHEETLTTPRESPVALKTGSQN